MTLRVVVWGTGNAGRPAIRAVAAHRDLELVGAVVADPAKVGRDAGELAGIGPLGVAATDDVSVALADDVDAVVYTATGDTRSDAALADLVRCLEAGRNVVSTAFYALLHPRTGPRSVLDVVESACTVGDASEYVSGFDPGWALDILPALVSGVGAGITEVRVQELFNYALYDQPAVVRDVIGFGGPMDRLPLMLLDLSLQMVWAPTLHILADYLELELDDVTTFVERRPLDRTIAVPGMGTFEAGTQGAFRFEVRGRAGDRVPVVVEHVTRIDDDCAPDWLRPAFPGGEHRVQLTGHPNLTVAVQRDRARRAGRGGRRQRQRGEPDRERHSRGVRGGTRTPEPARPPARDGRPPAQRLTRYHGTRPSPRCSTAASSVAAKPAPIAAIVSRSAVTVPSGAACTKRAARLTTGP